MDQLSRHEIFIPEDAEVKRIALQSLPRSLLTRMGLYSSDGGASGKLTDSPEGIWICPAYLRSKGQKLVLDTNSLLENMSSKISNEFRVVSSNRTVHKMLLNTINGVKVSAPDLLPGLARWTHHIAVIIYQGRIYLSIKKPRKSQRQGETREAPTTSKLATPSTSGTSSSSQRKELINGIRPEGIQTQCKEAQCGNNTAVQTSSIVGRPTNKVDEQSQSYMLNGVTSEQTSAETESSMNPGPSAAEREAPNTCQNNIMYTNSQMDRRNQSSSSLLQQPCDFKELEKDEKIAQIKAKLRLQEAALQNLTK